MSYYRRRSYRSWRSRGWGYSGPSKYSVLVGYFGDAVSEIKKTFLTLDQDALEDLLADYGAIHGEAAQKYATTTYPKWKKGSVNLSGETMERLVELVPPYLSAEQRYGLLTKVLERHKTKNRAWKTIKINIKEPNDGFSQLDDALASMQKNDALAHLPESVMKAATWLYDDDVTACRAMLAQAENKENELMRTNAKREIELLKRTISSGQVKSASYSVEMPAGKLEVIAYTPSKCFVASACFGENANETQILREWRDNYLLERKLGKKFIIWYYKNGEWLASFAEKYHGVRAFSRFAISLFIKHCVLTKSGASNAL